MVIALAVCEEDPHQRGRTVLRRPTSLQPPTSKQTHKTACTARINEPTSQFMGAKEDPLNQ